MKEHKYHIIAAAVFGTLLLFPQVINQSFYLHLMILVFLYALLGGAWNMIGGYAGQASLGHAVYFAIGAYTSTMMTLEFGINPWIGMLTGAVLAVLVSAALGYPCFRIKGHYFVIATIALGEIAFVLFTNWEWVGGAVGKHLPILSTNFIDFQFAGKMPYYYVALTLLTLQVAFTYFMEKSHFEYYFQAIRKDEDTARSLGINITRYKMFAMAFSALFMAFGGTFYAQYLLYIDPESVLPMMLSIQVCLIAILGGIGTVFGPVLGAFIMIPLAEFSRAWFGGSGSALDLVMYGLLIMVFAVMKPSGLMGFITGK
ncbi:branched-chain amino acid ABC transporter permease [Acetonema longum]|uniref:Inner-membrane translocator n=1 Tax=Acetonema longum DSM 6540 TaxID=1009370 RepID=F7NHT3_9FIRM|nr:branched-chain amino acid ABC transporter permease [Acetonema longum]EGO64458.1 inner-membrane translocator [Acetonema longum DSM 6540]